MAQYSTSVHECRAFDASVVPDIVLATNASSIVDDDVATMCIAVKKVACDKKQG